MMIDSSEGGFSEGTRAYPDGDNRPITHLALNVEPGGVRARLQAMRKLSRSG
jgi:hypothetical protein